MRETNLLCSGKKCRKDYFGYRFAIFILPQLTITLVADHPERKRTMSKKQGTDNLHYKVQCTQKC